MDFLYLVEIYSLFSFDFFARVCVCVCNVGSAFVRSDLLLFHTRYSCWFFSFSSFQRESFTSLFVFLTQLLAFVHIHFLGCSLFSFWTNYVKSHAVHLLFGFVHRVILCFCLFISHLSGQILSAFSSNLQLRNSIFGCFRKKRRILKSQNTPFGATRLNNN